MTPPVDRLLAVVFVLLVILYTYRSIVDSRQSSSSTSTSSTSSTSSSSSSSSSVRFGSLNNKGDSSIEPVALASIAVGPKARYSASFLLQSFIRNSAFNGVFLFDHGLAVLFRLFASRSRRASRDARRLLAHHRQSHWRRAAASPASVVPFSKSIATVRPRGSASPTLSASASKSSGSKRASSTSFRATTTSFSWTLTCSLVSRLQPFVDHCLAKRSLARRRLCFHALHRHWQHRLALPHWRHLALARTLARPAQGVGHHHQSGHSSRRTSAPSSTRSTCSRSPRVAFITIDDETRFFAFINGTCVERNKPYTFMHTTSYRLANGEKFGFTNVTLTQHFESAYHTPWKPWSGTNSTSFEDQVMSLKAKMQLQREEVEPLENVPFKRPTMIALRKQVLVEMEAEIGGADSVQGQEPVQGLWRRAGRRREARGQRRHWRQRLRALTIILAKCSICFFLGFVFSRGVWTRAAFEHQTDRTRTGSGETVAVTISSPA
jgi:hypothetical protein